MTYRCTRLAALLVAALALAAGCARAPDGAAADPGDHNAAPATAQAPKPEQEQEQELDWLDMLPADELKALETGDVPEVEHSGDRAMPQYGTFRTVQAVLARPVRLPGYVVPLENDADGQLREFLFVPYYGACIHVPPPPPNQIVHVRLPAAIPMPDMYSPFFLAGHLAAERSDDALAGSAYTMRDARLRPYEP